MLFKVQIVLRLIVDYLFFWGELQQYLELGNQVSPENVA